MSISTLESAFKILPLPLKHQGETQMLAPKETMGENKTFGRGRCLSGTMSDTPSVECSFIDLGNLELLSGRCTPIHAWEEDTGRSSVTLCYRGLPEYSNGSVRYRIHSGEVLMLPRDGGRISTGYLSSVNFPLDHKRLKRTISVTAGEKAAEMVSLNQPFAFGSGKHTQESRLVDALFALIGVVDGLMAVEKRLGSCLGFDEQIYRLFAMLVLQSTGKSYSRTEQSVRGGKTLDLLVDYIKHNCHLNLTLTDLEEQSHCSPRQLQNLFRQKFECTPMQFVRRQRLSSAMEKLQTADWDTTVTSVSRDCGYRCVSNFTTDFHEQFGLTPSTVLRASRRR